MSFNDFMNGFTIFMETEPLSKNTIRSYRGNLNGFRTWLLSTDGSDDMTLVNRYHLLEYRSYLEKAHTLHPSSMNVHISTLKTYFKWLHDSNHIAYNPAENLKIKRIQNSSGEPRALSEKELSRFIHVILSYKNTPKMLRDLAMFRLMDLAGLRCEEVSMLNQHDLQFEEPSKVIVRAGKGDKFRTVPMNSELKKVLLKYLSDAVIDSSPLFPGKHGNTRFALSSMRKNYSEYATRANIKKSSPHSLRHTFGTRLAKNNAPIQMIAELMGHDSIETTRKYTKAGYKDQLIYLNQLD